MPSKKNSVSSVKSDVYSPATTVDKCELVHGDSPQGQLCSDAALVILDDFADGDDKGLLQDEKRTPKREPSRQVKLKFLNGLRGIACLFVVHRHAGYLGESTLAPSSVDTFFVLSAFLLTMLNEAKICRLITRRESARQWGVTLLDYLVKRIMRVYPLFALVALVLTCMTEDTRNHYYNLAHYNIEHWSISDILTFKKRYYLFWTLPVEISYYIIIPLFLVGICLLNKWKWIIIVPLYMWVYHEGGHSNRRGHGEFRPHLSTFVAGSLAAVVYLELSKWMKHRHFEPRGWHLAAARMLELLMITSILSDVSRGLLDRWFGGSLFPKQDSEVPSISLPVSALIVIEAMAPSALSRAMEWNVLCFTGKISFSMYLLHPFVNFQPWLLELPRIDQFIVRLVLTYALASFSYFVVERNCQHLAVKIGKLLVDQNH